MKTNQETRQGGLYALAAFTAWGLIPLYFKMLGSVSAIEILCHRGVWAAIWLAAWLHYKHEWHRVKEIIHSRSALSALCLTAFLIAINWGIFMWAVNAGRVLETSLGYFINPLVNVLLGRLFLGERLRPAQWLAVALAVCATLNLIFQYAQFPWIALSLAFSFGFYGLIRKVIGVDALPGLFIETAFLSPLLLGYMLYIGIIGQAHFMNADMKTDILLVSAGIITLLPLLWFANAAQHLRLATLGFFQYITPSMTFLLAVLLFKEHFTVTHLITFSLIWIGLLLFTVDNVRFARRQTVAADTVSARN